MRIAIILSLFFVAQSVYANKGTPYSIKGTVPATEKSKLAYLYIYSAGKQYPSQLIGVPITNGKFVFNGTAYKDSLGLANGVLFLHNKPGLTKKEYIGLYQNGLKFKHRKVVLEPAVTVDVATTIDMARVQGDLLNEQQNELQRIRQMEIDDFYALAKWRDQQEALAKGNKDALLKLRGDYFQGMQDNQNKRDKAQFDFIRKYPESPFSLQFLKGVVMMNEHMTDNFRAMVNACIADLPADVKAKPFMQQVIKSIATLKKYESKLAAGVAIPDHAFTIKGEAPVSISDFKGKYLLLDFWTSWCGPCRAEHHNMKQVYAQYKDRGFEILQVSMDDKEAKWLKALEEDNLPWVQVRCLAGWDKELAALYDVKGVPTTYLIDPQGNIIARNLRGEALNKKLAEVIK